MRQVVLRAAQWIYSARIRGADGSLKYPERWISLREYLTSMCNDLSSKRKILSECFPSNSSSRVVPVPLAEAGGLFISPDISDWIGKKCKGEVLTVANIPTLLYRETSVVVNGGRWCGHDKRIRVVFSIANELVTEAAERIRAFGASLSS